MYGEVEGDAPHKDQSELEALHLPGDCATAARGCSVLKYHQSRGEIRDSRQSLNLIMFYYGELFKL